MSGSSNHKRRNDRGVEASISGRRGFELPQKGALGIIVVAQVAADQRGKMEVVNGVEILTNFPRAAYSCPRRRKEAFVSAPSRIHQEDLRLMAKSFYFPSGHQMLVPAMTDRAAYPPWLHCHHSYGQLLTLYLLFRRHEVPPPSDNVIRYCFSLKQCPLARGSPEDSPHDGMHYISVQVGEYRVLL
ncbi:hypothetical protein ACOSP7_013242 [Xanthoceras sorbifolium]